MRSPRILLLAAVSMSLSTAASDVALAQSGQTGQSAQAVQTAQSDAKGSFDTLKTLDGAWEGPVTTDPPVPELGSGTTAKVWLRVTSMGNALMHEMKMAGRPDDPITMLYLDEGRLLLTHYCDAGNRPRMVGKASPDGKTVEFDFLDITGSTQYGHMHRSAITMIDADHHTEDWTFMLPGDKHVRAHFDLRRAKPEAGK
jgi:hypothetical protein